MFARSLSLQRRHAGNVTLYDALGPIPAGVVIETLEFTVHQELLGTVILAASVGPSSIPGAESLRVGRSLLLDATDRTFDVPSIVWIFGAAAFESFSIPVGILVSTGSQYVIVGSFMAASGGLLVGVQIRQAKPISRAEVISQGAS